MFNLAKSAHKGIKALMDAGHLGQGSADDIGQFFLKNNGKLDLAKVGDYVGGQEEAEKLVLRQLLETIEVRGQTFFLLLGDRPDFDAFRERILVPIRDRFYQVPEWLPMEQCFFRGRYFPEGPPR